jgi:excisionase family DNA binding protein
MIAPSRLPEPQPFRLALRADECADALGISERTLAAMVAADAIPHVYVGKRNLRFPVAALQKWLDAQTTMPAGMGPAVLQEDLP